MFSCAYKEFRKKRCARVLTRSFSDPVKYSALEHGISIWDFPRKRVGRPKDKWMAEGLADLWQGLRGQAVQVELANKTFNTVKTNDPVNQQLIAEMIRIFISATVASPQNNRAAHEWRSSK